MINGDTNTGFTGCLHVKGFTKSSFIFMIEVFVRKGVSSIGWDKNISYSRIGIIKLVFLL